MKILINNITLKDKKELKVFYTHFCQAFPDENERESLNNIIRSLSKTDTKNKYHIISYLDNNNFLGGAIFDYLNDANAGIIEYIFVNKQFQQKGIGKSILLEVLKILNTDAKIQNKPLKYLFCEVDDPIYRASNDRYYFTFWAKNKLKKIDFIYNNL